MTELPQHDMCHELALSRQGALFCKSGARVLGVIWPFGIAQSLHCSGRGEKLKESSRLAGERHTKTILGLLLRTHQVGGP